MPKLISITSNNYNAIIIAKNIIDKKNCLRYTSVHNLKLVVVK